MTEQKTPATENAASDDEFANRVNDTIQKVHAAAREIIAAEGIGIDIMSLALGICAVDASAAMAVEHKLDIGSMMDYLEYNMRQRVDVSMEFYRKGLEELLQEQQEAANA